MRSDNEEADAELASFANRIEEAWEIKLIAEKAKAAAEGYVQGRQSVTDCNQPKDVPTTEKSSQVGHAAMMREALEFAVKQLIAAIEDDSLGGNILYLAGCMRTVANKCKSALSAPARNCDRFADELDAQIEFLNDIWIISVTKDTMLERDKFENWTEEMKSIYAKWLFAEAKGEAK